MEPILKLEDVTKLFGGVVAARNVTFDVYPGQIHGLIGPNGAGKTTLMNLISGIYKCDAGKIFIESKDVTNVPSFVRAQMGLGRTFQTPRFLQRSSIRENLLLGTDLFDQHSYTQSFFMKKGISLDEKLADIMPVAGFSFDWDEDIMALSFGQRKLLEIVRSMLFEPKIMLVDEPAAGLNNCEIENAMALLNLAATQYNTGVLLIEHSMDMIMNICKKIVVINFGEVIAIGNPEEISSNIQVIEAYLGREMNAKN